MIHSRPSPFSRAALPGWGLIVVAPILLLSLSVHAGDSAPIRLDARQKKGVKSITKKEMVKYIAHLASEGFQGREAGTETGYKAGDFVASEFERLGLKPGGENGTYFQAFPLGGPVSRKSMQESNIVEVTTRRKPKKGDDSRTFRFHYDFIPLPFSASMMVDAAPVTFVGYGISEKDKGYDDYKGKRVKGRVVVALDHVPMEGQEAGPFREDEKKYSDLLQKAKTAKEKGAVGLILVKDMRNHPGEGGVPKEHMGGWPPDPDKGPEDVGIPVVYVSSEAADFILGSKDLEKLQKKIDSKGKPATTSISSRFVRLQVTSFGQVKGGGRNVIGILEGSDPELSKEAIVIGAHYDHVGLGRFGSRGGSGEVHNGANDNASGTSGLLEVAEAFAEQEISIRRTIVFIAFDGEEKGLVGSTYYVTAPVVPIEQTVAMLNMDMIGVNPKFEVFIGAGQENASLEEIHVAANRIIGLSIRYDDMERFRKRSDQFPFLEKGVPALFFFSGEHPEYHTSRDDLGLINPGLAQGIARLTFITALEVVNRDARP